MGDSLNETHEFSFDNEFSEELANSDDDTNTSIHSTPSLLAGLSSKSEPSAMRIQAKADGYAASESSMTPTSSGHMRTPPVARHRKTLSLDNAKHEWGGKLNKLMDKLKGTEKVEGSQRMVDAAAREQTIMSVKEVWDMEIIPHFHEQKGTKRFRELVWKGIPTKHRGKAWCLAIGNSMNITEELYQIMVKNARTSRNAVEAAFKRGLSEEDIEVMFPGKMNSLSLIKLDLERTFPELGFFHQGTPEFESLQDVLEAYVAYRPDMGYVQGMSYIAGMLLLNMSACESFICMAHLLNSNHMRALFRMESPDIDLRFAVFDHLLAEYLPETSKYLIELNISSNLYVVEWFMTIFARLLNLELSSRLWDLYVLDGEVFAFRASLGIIKVLTPKLIGSSFEDCLGVLLNIPKDMSESKTIKIIRSINLPPARYQAAIASCKKALSIN